jgi:glutathione S-transferase
MKRPRETSKSIATSFNRPREITDNLELLDSILNKHQTTFIAGETLSIADIQIFHEITNLLIYEIPFSNYKA